VAGRLRPARVQAERREPKRYGCAVPGPLILLGADPGATTPAEIVALLSGPAVVLPTASAFEHPRRVAAAVVEWLGGHGVDAHELDVLTRRDALDGANVAAVRGASTIVLCGGTAMHARSVFKDTLVWAALGEAHAAGSTVVAAGAGGTVLADPMADSRGGGLTLGLGLVARMAVLAGSTRWPLAQVKRMRHLAGPEVVVVTIADDAALVRQAGGWQSFGPVELHVDNRIVGLDALPAG
jgi:cyanophycinase